MKKRLLRSIPTIAGTILIFVLANVETSGQTWDQSSTHTYTSGNVGINNTSIPASNARLQIDNFIPPSQSGLTELQINRAVATASSKNILEINNSTFAPSYPLFIVDANGNVAINKATASKLLDVGGNINGDGNLTIGGTGNITNDLTVGGSLNVTGNYIKGLTSTNTLVMTTNAGSSDGPTIEMYGINHPDPTRAGSFHFTSFGPASLPSGAGPLFGYIFYNYDATVTNPGWTPNVAITTSGKMVIGKDLILNSWSATPGDYNLYVAGGILTEKLKVALDPQNGGDWSDFVFAKNYKLMPLNKVENYINQNKHLPEIPSASEVGKDGIDVAQMDARLLQKIEELTLYVIQQQKEIELLKKKVN